MPKLVLPPQIPNRVKRAAAAVERIRGVHMTFASVHVIEVVAGLGIDYIYLDGEHGGFESRELEAGCLVAERYGMTPIARIPDLSQATIGFYMDRGVKGIVLPHVTAPEQVREVVSHLYHAPLGERSLGSGRPHHGLYANREMIEETNANTSLCVMIENVESLACAAELAAVEGVDYLSFGPNDLAQSMGLAGQPGHPEVVAAIAKASEEIRGAGKPVREDFMSYAWIGEILVEGVRALVNENGNG